MLRRSSYASVAAGNSAGSSGSQPIRAGAFAHIANSGSASGPQSSHPRHPPRAVDADGHHNNMSASWGRSGPLPSYSSQFGYLSNYGAGAQEPLHAFFVPSYLRGSRHAEKVEEAHRAKIAAQRDYRSNHSSNAGSLSTSSSSVNLHKMAPSHRGMTHDIIERTPGFPEETVAPWPTKWSDVDKYNSLDVLEDGREARYSGAQRGHEEAAAVRANYSMPRQCGIYYFEVTVVSKGKDGRMIGVGFSGPKVALTRIPGWEPESYAYHGDDGQIFSSSTTGKPYGPKFGNMDTIGCGINFRTGTAFFTKNGVSLGTAFKDIKTDRPWFPSIGMKRPGETLKANFGQDAFAFDIDRMVEAEQAIIQAEISRTTLRDLPEKSAQDDTSLIHDLVAQYLAHDGYVETARAFAAEVMEESKSLANGSTSNLKQISAEEDLDAMNRQKIRASILDGDIDKALKHTHAYYPSVLRDNENIYFKLRCRKFIEMIRRCNELQAHYQPPNPPSKRSTAANGNRNSAITDDYDFEMELDEGLNPHNGTSTWGTENMDLEDDFDDNQAKYNNLTQETLSYGVELKSEFASDPRREVKKALEDTFALIAYENAAESSLAPLLEKNGRIPIAEELNSAILVSLGKSSSAALERLTAQTEALVSDLAEDGGPGAFINVRRDFLQ